jgi:hypothetical protein
MRVLILGEEAPGSLMASYARGFAELGVETRTFCLARTYASTLPAIRSRALRRVAEPVLLGAFNERVTDELSGIEADLVLVIKGQRLSAPTVDSIRESSGAAVVNFYPDDPSGRAIEQARLWPQCAGRLRRVLHVRAPPDAGL